MALIRYLPLSFAFVPALALGCTDAELQGAVPIDRDGFAETDGTTVFDTEDGGDDGDDGDDTTADTGDDTTADTGDSDDTTVDTSDTRDTNIGCVSDEQCRGVLGDLGPCDEPLCDAASGACFAQRRADCCVVDAECPRLDDPCLSNRCPIPGGSCVPLSICTECGGDDDCPSNDPCTLGTCGADRQCVYTPNPACSQCQTDEQCDDSTTCTNDQCLGGRCVHEPVPGCCSLDADCRDEDPCTRDFCRPGSGLCGFEPIPGCNECTPDLCDDFDPCTQDICTDLGCQHITDPDCRGCQGDGQCNDGDQCTSDRCVNGRCEHPPAVGPDGTLVCGCEDPSLCDDGDPCTVDRCDGGQCFNLPDPTQPDCQACGGSSCDDFDPCTTDFCDGSLCQHIATPGIPGCDGECMSDLQCPPPDMCSKSFCDVQVGACVTFTVPDCCQGDDMCDDGDRCTRDACRDDGLCVHEQIPGCADTCADGCDDGDPCTLDRCTSVGTCTNTEIDGCDLRCNDDGDCEDASECTDNRCIDDVCVTEILPNCCRNDNDCRDGNACTDQDCQQGTCVYETFDCDDGDPCTFDYCDQDGGGECISLPDPNGPGCVCTPERLWVRSFSDGETPDVNIDGSGFGIGWKVDAVRPNSPPRSLHYGDDEGQDYANGFRTFGRATGPELEVPTTAGEVRLEFNVWLDIDADVERDSFRARVLWGDQNVAVWDRVTVGPERFQTWLPVSVALPNDVIGETIRVRFVFDSLDGEGNEGQGVFVDDVVVYTTCP